MKKYNSENEILEIVRGFETGTISRDAWRHAEHLTVACYYAFHHPLEEATDKMRSGIFNLLKSFAVDLTKEMPYHETLTVFWMRTISGAMNNRNGDSFLETVNRVLETSCDKDLPLRFYSRELLFSERARAAFVEPDLQEFSG